MHGVKKPYGAIALRLILRVAPCVEQLQNQLRLL
jgi:hypothetical protein